MSAPQSAPPRSASTRDDPLLAEILHPEDLPAVLAGMGLAAPVRVLALVGGAANLEPRVTAALESLLGVLAPLLDALGVTVVDGGTDFGVMALTGQARRSAGARFPLLGVAARGTVAVQGSAGVPLEPNHSHILLVPGGRWGDESPWISAAAQVLAGGRPSLTLVAAGGAITRLDIGNHLRAGRRLLTLAGSGGSADALADWRRGGAPMADLDLDPRILDRVEVLDLDGAPGVLPDLLMRRLAD